MKKLRCREVRYNPRQIASKGRADWEGRPWIHCNTSMLLLTVTFLKIRDNFN